MRKTHPIIFYDGVCKFCNSSINLVLKLDKKRIFRYCHFQSAKGQSMMKEYNVPEEIINSMGSIVLFIPKGDDYEYKLKSTAILNIFYLLGFPWSLMYSFILVPKFIRDKMYSLVASNRYKIFGKYDKCIIPNKKMKELWIDEEETEEKDESKEQQ